LNKNITLILVLALLAASCTITPLPVEATPRTIIVPGDYPTIAAAIGNATQGDTIHVKKGFYEEPSLVINKTITLLGEDANNTIITNIDKPVPIPGQAFLTQPTIAVQINTDNAKITGFTIAGAFIAITTNGNENQITGNIINGEGEGVNLNGDNNTVAQNTISSEIGNSFIECTGSYNTITGNAMTGSTGGGLNIVGSFNIVYGNTLTDCEAFGSIDVSGDGNIIAKNNLTNSGDIQIERGSNNAVYTNRIIHGGGIGVVTYAYNNTFYANHVANCGNGLTIGGEPARSGSNIVYHNNFINNEHQVWTGYELTYGTDTFDKGKEGNYWSDYNGTDADGDGIGDTPYVIDANRQDNYPLMTPFDIEGVTMQFPEWANIPPSPSPSPSQEPNSTQDPQPSSSLESSVTIFIILIIVVILGVFVFRKRRRVVKTGNKNHEKKVE
jgi:nitrous oxidase accessory protein NosD